MIFRHGNQVRAQRDQPPRGTWSRYANRTGTVYSINREADEIGVRFGQSSLTAWFRPDELELISLRAPQRRSTGTLLKLTSD